METSLGLSRACRESFDLKDIFNEANDIQTTQCDIYQVRQQMWYWCEILSTWWAKMWPYLCILESGGHKGITKDADQWMNGKIFWLKTPSFLFRKTCLYSSSTCFWVKASAGRKSSTCSQRAKNLNSATLRVFILSLFNNTVQNFFREKSWNIWPLLWGEVCQCDLHNSTVEVLKPNQTGGIKTVPNFFYTIRLWRFLKQSEHIKGCLSVYLTFASEGKKRRRPFLGPIFTRVQGPNRQWRVRP